LTAEVPRGVEVRRVQLAVLECDCEARECVGAQDFGVGARKGIIRLRSLVDTHAELPGVKISRQETVFGRGHDLFEELSHHSRIGPGGSVVSQRVKRIDQVQGGDRRAIDSCLMGRQ
jgi:hypothetical protein